jgi:hypothetical protein
MDEGLDPDLYKHLSIIQKDEHDRNDMAKDPHEVTHYCDSVRYLCTSHAHTPREPKEEKTAQQKHKESVIAAHKSKKSGGRRFMRG